jgi:Protein of unknown function (DUF2637)
MTMGTHSKPLNGTVANGHQLEPFTFAPGPLSAWPRDDPGQPRTADKPGRWHAIDGDTTIRVLAAIVVLAVAAFAAIVSYSHIFELGFHHGQDGAAARLLPLSVDGLIASASLVMLHAARRDLDPPWLARVMLALGVGATVAANVAYGLPFGWLSAVVSAWPAVAFVGSVEMAVRFVRDARHDGASDMTDDVKGNSGDMMADLRDDKAAVVAARLKIETGRLRAPRGKSGLTVEEEAARDGVSVRTVQRRRARNRSTT